MTEIKEVLAQFTTDVIGNVIFGLELNTLDDPDSKFRKMGRRFFGRGSNLLIKMFFLTSFRSLAQKLRLKLIPTEISVFFKGIVEQTVEYRLKNKIERNDVMNLLLKAESEDGKLTMDELAAQCFVFFIAGFETSSSTSTFVLYNLALNQDIQEQLRDEIKEVLAGNDEKITYETMKEMKLLQMVINGKEVAEFINFSSIFSSLRIPSNVSTHLSTYQEVIKGIQNPKLELNNPKKYRNLNSGPRYSQRSRILP